MKKKDLNSLVILIAVLCVVATSIALIWKRGK